MAAEAEVLKRKYLKKANALKERRRPTSVVEPVDSRYAFQHSIECVNTLECTSVRRGCDSRPHRSCWEGTAKAHVENEPGPQLSPSPLTGQMVVAAESPSLAHTDDTPAGVPCDGCDKAVTHNKQLSVQLAAQRRANQELKRLLVASVGSELNGQFERVAQEKAELSVELEDTLQQLTRDWEEIERLAIAADLWRSKFVASCVIVEELSQWRVALVRQLRAGEAALQDLLTEHVELGRAVRAAQEDLRHVHASFAASLQCEGRPRVLPVSSCGTVRDSLASLQQMSSDLSEWVGLRRHPSTGHHVHQTHLHLQPTQAEVAATKVLVCQDELLEACEQTAVSSPAHVCPHPNPSPTMTPRLPSLLRTFRAFLSSREDHTQIHFKCRKCKGKTLVI